VAGEPIENLDLAERRALPCGRTSARRATPKKGDQSGSYRESNLLQRVLHPAGEAAGLGRVTWHQFRHIHSSLLHDLGVPAKIAQQQLGHASVDTTLKIYTHPIEKSHRRAIDDLEGVLFPSVPKFGPRGRKDVA
jgi:integrase